MSRPDLLELTPQALTALANAGFVKRAQKDVAAGLLPRIEAADDGEVAAHFDDGVSTRLPPGRTLRDASCTCPASGMCRHRVMLVLAYQAQAQAPEQDSAPASGSATQAQEPLQAEVWTPAEFDDAALTQVFSPSVQAQAGELAAQRPVIALLPGVGEQQPPSARLPMCSVRFFSRSSLAHARCDCKQGSGCAHVLMAVWAYQQTGPMTADAPERMVELGPRLGSATAPAPQARKLLDSEAARSAQQALDQLLAALWLDGASQPLLALAARFEALRTQVQALGWAWVDDGLHELWQLLQAHQARSSRFDAHRLLAVATELWARLRAAAHAEGCQPDAAPPLLASQILGLGVKGELALDHLRLVSLGAALWRSETAEGASLLFADPDTQTVTVLEREWPLADDNNTGPAATALLHRRVAGFPLRQLASGQVITKTAVRRANGLIDIGASTRQTGVMPLSPRSWDDLAAPLKHHSLATLRQALESALPDFATPRQAATGAAAGTGGALHVLASEQLRLLEQAWDAGAQVLHAKLATGEEAGADAEERHVLHLALPHHAAAPAAVDTLARALAGEWGPLRAVAGSVQLQAGQLVMQPLALLTVERGLALQAEPGAGPQQLPLAQGSPERGALQALTASSLDMLAVWLRQGLRHQSASGLVRGGEQARQLSQAGLPRCAALMQEALNKLRDSEHPTLLASLGALTLLLQDQK
ncbi:SWIM zinc finger family protein [Comamonas sp. GB3 AK4-5]|uniref:SWIM zinc finger family protein n=1 Tax=Comamonas sp. GB3 AK4-5 TaxID=3231487 RepID=UPI00351F6412